MKFDLVVAIFSNLVANDYKSHVVVNGLVTFWLISSSVCKFVFGSTCSTKNINDVGTKTQIHAHSLTHFAHVNEDKKTKKNIKKIHKHYMHCW